MKRFRIDIEHTFFAHEQEDFEGARQNILNNVSIDDLHELISNSTVIEIDEGGNEIAIEDK
tara:strand:+ start:107 stop:289 length:183 start_codon:yes stop_codon:yes gene_type:complete